MLCMQDKPLMPMLMVCPHVPDISAAVIRLAESDPELIPDYVHDETDLRYTIVWDCIEDQVLANNKFPTDLSYWYDIPQEPDFASCHRKSSAECQ